MLVIFILLYLVFQVCVCVCRSCCVARGEGKGRLVRVSRQEVMLQKRKMLNRSMAYFCRVLSKNSVSPPPAFLLVEAR